MISDDGAMMISMSMNPIDGQWWLIIIIISIDHSIDDEWIWLIMIIGIDDQLNEWQWMLGMMDNDCKEYHSLTFMHSDDF